MKINKEASLKKFNTFNVSETANCIYEVEEIIQLKKILSDIKGQILILGGGSNVLFTKRFEGTIINLRNKGINVIRENKDSILVEVCAGENWNDFVIWAVENNYGGVENLSLIPGNVGAAPIQNIGAYGVELDSVFESCRAISLENKNVKIFHKIDCDFTYRSSVFKEKLKNKYIISRVVFKLTKKSHFLKTNYKPLKELIKIKNISNPTIQDISNLVKEIRSSKLPDPKIIGNCGSFFKNPIISKNKLEKISSINKLIPFYKLSDEKFKIPAAWLIEKCGMKGRIEGQTGTHKEHALVIINLGAATGTEIYNFSQKIKKLVLKKFNILLEEEVNIID